ncbi:1092_t:CDS:2, partial [Racocetra persica]
MEEKKLDKNSENRKEKSNFLEEIWYDCYLYNGIGGHEDKEKALKLYKEITNAVLL